MSTVSQGSDFYVGYLHEDNGFTSSPTDSTTKALGADAVVDNAEGANQAQQVFGPGSRVPIDIVEQLFNGAWAATFTYTNPWWLNWLFGAPSTVDNADGSYTHTWSGEEPQSQQILINRTDGTKERVLEGCICTQATINPSVNGYATVNLTGAYASEKTTTSPTLTSQPTIDEKPFTFADTTLALTGSNIAKVQNASLTIANNQRLIPELGSRVAVDYSPRTLVPTIDFEKLNESGGVTHLENMYGGSTSVQQDVDASDAMTLTADNGKAAGSGINKGEFNLTGTFPESYNELGLGDPERDMAEQINRLITSMTVDHTNEVSAAV